MWPVLKISEGSVLVFSSGGVPDTPPPTPQLLEMVGQQDQHVDDLVHIDVILVDKKQPEFVSKYNQVNEIQHVSIWKGRGRERERERQNHLFALSLYLHSLVSLLRLVCFINGKWSANRGVEDSETCFVSGKWSAEVKEWIKMKCFTCLRLHYWLVCLISKS